MNKLATSLWRIASLLACLCIAGPVPTSAQSTPQGGEERINSFTTGHQRRAKVSKDGAGNFVVVFEDGGRDGSGPGIFGKLFDSSGGLLTGPFQINTHTTGNQVSPAVDMAGSGEFVVVWASSDQDGDGYGIFGRRFAAGATPSGGEFAVNSNTVGQQILPDVAVDEAGDFVVVWESDTVTYQDYANVWARRFQSGVAQGDDSRVNEVTRYFQGDPRVAMTSSGSFVVVWESCYQDGSVEGVFARRYDPSGNALAAEFQVNTYTPENQLYPSIAMDGLGNFVVVWQSDTQDGSLFGVMGQRFDNTGNAVEGEFQANQHTIHNQQLAEVDMDAHGNFAVTWESFAQDGSGATTVGRRYDAAGVPEGGEFVVNSFTLGDQSVPAVAMDSGGDFVVVWTDAVQDGSLTGVYSQRYRCAPLPGTVSDLSVALIHSGADLQFNWTGGTPDVTDYVVMEDTVPSGGFTSQAGTVPAATTSLIIPAPAGNRYYLVTGRNACGFGPKK